MSPVTINVDRRELEVEEGRLLIEVLLENGIEIPYFCYHEALGADGNCRMCMVEIDGQKRPQIACDTFVHEGMIVRTHGESIEKVRRSILELELINHPVDCPICDQAGECKLQDFYMEYGLHDSHIEPSQKVHHAKHVDLGSNVMLDQERCVLCARCTRFTADVTKTHELGIVGRGDHAKVTTMPGRKLDNPYAMNVVDLCPVGALTSKEFRFHQRVWFLTSTPSVCHGCAKGCNIYIDHNREKYKDDTIYRFRPRVNREVNGHFICDEGRMSYKKLEENRQLSAYVDNEKAEIGEALKAVRDAIRRCNGDIVVLSDANLYSEELEALKAFAAEIDAQLLCPRDVYRDESFGDDWLKSVWRSANIRTVETMGLAEAPESGDIALLINFNHPSVATFDAGQVVSFQTNEGFQGDVTLPLAAFSELSGSLCNEDGVVQRCEKAVTPSVPIPGVQEWIERIQGDSDE